MTSDNLERIIHRDVPSQVPMTVTRASWSRMVDHCKTEGTIWACRLNGARINAKVVWMNVYNKDSGSWEHRTPVAHMYCSGCDKAPAVRGDDVIFSIELMSVAM